MTDCAKLRESLEMLYTARWNVPRAALHCGLSPDEMETTFTEEVGSGRLLPQEWGCPTTIQLNLGL